MSNNMTQTKLIAFHGEESIKTKYVKAMKADIKAERLLPGHYWDGESGCFVGCVIRGNEHSKFETAIGIPRMLAKIADGVFEGLGEQARRQKFAVDFLSAPKVGADLTGVTDKFLHWLLGDKKDGIIKYAKTEAQRKAIQDIIDLYARKIKGEVISSDTWWTARGVARNAAAAAAYAAAAADAAAAAAAYAAAADAADADAAARIDSRQRQANKLISLLKAAPVAIKEAA